MRRIGVAMTGAAVRPAVVAMRRDFSPSTRIKFCEGRELKQNGNNTALASSSARKRVPGRRATSPCRPGSMFSIQATQLR